MIHGYITDGQLINLVYTLVSSLANRFLMTSTESRTVNHTIWAAQLADARDSNPHRTSPMTLTALLQEPRPLLSPISLHGVGIS